MEFTAAASWLNSFFAGFDNGILEFMHTLETSAGAVLTPLAKFITLIGEKGLIMFILAFAFMLFPKTRKLGVCMFGAVCCGALITNIILKDLIARPRPFEAMAPFMKYWNNVGSPAEDGFSFPSGHVTAAAAGMAAMMFVKGKKFILPSALYVFLMCFSRNYLMAHYPSDVLAASIVGLFSAFVAYLIASFIFEYCEDNDDLPFFNTVLYFRVPLPDMSGLINKINRVPSRDSKAAKSEKKRASAHAAPAKDSGRHSAKDTGRHSVRDTGRHSARHTAAAQQPKDDDDFNFTVDMADELLSDTGSLELDIDALRSEDEKPAEEKSEPAKPAKRNAKREKAAAPAFLGNAMAKAADLAKKSKSGLASAQQAAKSRVGSSTGAISIHTSELDFDFASKDSGKKKGKSTSDWNERWEQYRARRDQAQVKTAPAEDGSAQMEFENIFGKAPAESAPQPEIQKAAEPPKTGEELSDTLSLFAEAPAQAAPAKPAEDEDVKEYKPAKAKKQAEPKKPEPPKAEPKPAPKAEVKKEEAPKAREEKAPEAPKANSDLNFDHMRRRPGTNTGSIEIDMDEIYSMINGSYDFSKD